jgi:hypothetical protein
MTDEGYQSPSTPTWRDLPGEADKVYVESVAYLLVAALMVWFLELEPMTFDETRRDGCTPLFFLFNDMQEKQGF